MRAPKVLSEAEQLAKADRDALRRAQQDEMEKQDKEIDDAVAATVRIGAYSNSYSFRYNVAGTRCYYLGSQASAISA